MSASSNERTQPRLIGWIISGTTLLLALIITHFTIIGSEYGRRSVTFLRARTAAIDGNFALVDHLLQNGLRREGVSRFIPSSLALWESDQGFSESSIRRFVDLVKLVKQEKLSAAGELFKELAPEIAVSANYLGEPVDDLLGKLDKLMAQAIEGYLRKRESSSEFHRSEEARQEITDQHLALQREFAALLGLAVANPKAEPVFYQEGILKGLPALKGLPDNIDSLPALGQQIKKMGATVQVPEGVNPHLYFLEKTEDIRTRSFAVKLQLESNNDKIKDLKNRISVGAQKLSDATPYLVKQFSGVLLIASRNTIQESSLLPYFMRELIDNYLS